MDNIQWLRDMFAMPHLAHIPLGESYSCKWFYIKHGKAWFNPKQVAIANGAEFRQFVLAEMFTHMGELKRIDISIE